MTDRVMFLLSRVASHEEAYAINRHKEEVERREFGTVGGGNEVVEIGKEGRENRNPLWSTPQSAGIPGESHLGESARGR